VGGALNSFLVEWSERRRFKAGVWLGRDAERQAAEAIAVKLVAARGGGGGGGGDDEQLINVDKGLFMCLCGCVCSFCFVKHVLMRRC
jgi:hypothetical protein